jgi:hypothetical protein
MEIPQGIVAWRKRASMILAEEYWNGDDHLSQGDPQGPNDRYEYLGSGVGDLEEFDAAVAWRLEHRPKTKEAVVRIRLFRPAGSRSPNTQELA